MVKLCKIHRLRLIIGLVVRIDLLSIFPSSTSSMVHDLCVASPPPREVYARKKRSASHEFLMMMQTHTGLPRVSREQKGVDGEGTRGTTHARSSRVKFKYEFSSCTQLILKLLARYCARLRAGPLRIHRVRAAWRAYRVICVPRRDVMTNSFAWVFMRAPIRQRTDRRCVCDQACAALDSYAYDVQRQRDVNFHFFFICRFLLFPLPVRCDIANRYNVFRYFLALVVEFRS